VKRASVFFVTVCGLVVMLLAPSVGLAQAESWSRPALVSGFVSGSGFPSITVDGNDNAYVVWSAIQGPQNSLLYYSRWDGQAWTRPIDIRFGGERSVLALDGFGQLNLLYLAAGKPTYAWAYTDRAASSKGWVDVSALSAAGGSSSIQMAIDDQGTIHVVRTQSPGVLYQQSRDRGQSWSDPAALSIQPADSRRVQLKIGTHGILHVAWDGLGAKGGNQSIRYTYSIDHGRTWAPAQQFFSPKGLPAQAAVGIAGDDHVVLLWQTLDHNETYYQVSNDDGVTWGQPAVIPNLTAGKPSTGFDQYTLATDSAGILHLAAVGRGANSDLPWLYHLQWDGQKWSKPEVVYDGPDFPEYPSLAVSNGNRLHLTWFTRGADSISSPPDGTYQVWYSTMVTSAPETSPPPTYTPAPLPSPTHALPTATVMPIATRTPFPVSSGASSPETSPWQQQLSVIAGIIPALVLIGIVVAIRLRPRRRY
jgi:hypothetical protein